MLLQDIRMSALHKSYGIVVALIHYPFGIIPLMPFIVSFMLLSLSRRYALFTVFLPNKFISCSNIIFG